VRVFLLLIAIVSMSALLMPGAALAQFEQERGEILRLRIRLEDAWAMKHFYDDQKRLALAKKQLLKHDLEHDLWQRYEDSLCSKERPTIQTGEEARWYDEACARFDAWKDTWSPRADAAATRVRECDAAIQAQQDAIVEIQRQLNDAIVTYMTAVAWDVLVVGHVKPESESQVEQPQQSNRGVRAGHAHRRRHGGPTVHVQRPFQFPQVQPPPAQRRRYY
jgi:hypothetical protein